jgi:hypothetical protein
MCNISWLKRVTYVTQVLGSIIDRDISYRDWRFSGLFHIQQADVDWN